MIHLFTYYSIGGGYKDLYLGNSSQADPCRFFLPLLNFERKQAEENNDLALKEKLERQSKLPKIEVLTTEQRFGLPAIVTNNITSQGGYQLLYTHVENEKFVIVLRGITGNDKDESGRQIPYLLCIMCDSSSDLPIMNTLAGYISQNMKTAKKQISSFLGFDAKENGLRFEQAEMLEWINSIGAQKEYKIVSLVSDKTIEIHAHANEVVLIIVPNNIKAEEILSKMRLTLPIVNKFRMNQILPKDNPELAKQYREQWQKEYNKKMRLYKKLGGVAVAVLILIVIIAKCTGKSN